MTEDQPLLTLSNLTIGYGGSSHPKIKIQESVSLSVSIGEMVALIGPNGCGKSTMLKTISSLLPTLGGDILIGGISLLSLNEREKALRRSLVLTNPTSLPDWTVKDLVTIGRYPYSDWMGRVSQKDQQIVEKSITQVGLESFAERKINTLSDGEKQRAFIAKALAQETPLILLDEPTAHLDLINRVEILLLLRRLAQDENRAIVISTHELEIALTLAHTIWLMKPSCQGIITGKPQDKALLRALSEVFERDSLCFENGRWKIKNLD